MDKTQKEKIREEFYKKFVTRCSDCDLLKDVEPNKVVDFILHIRDLAIKETERITEERMVKHIEGMKKDTRIVNGGEVVGACCAECRGQEECTCDTYNQALDDAINIIRNK